MYFSVLQYMHTVFIIHWSLWGPLVLKSENLPSQVLGFAAFFALVLKKVDQEEYGEPQIDESLRNTGTFFPVFNFCCTVLCEKTKHISTIFLCQMILMRCAQQEETVRAVSISHLLPLTSRGWGTTWLKSRKSSPSWGRFLVGEPLWYIKQHRRQCNTVWDADVRYLFVMQPIWDLCGCCSWWRTVRGTPTLTFWPNTFDRASAKGSQTVWVSRMCSTGQTRLCWATCLESTRVSMLWSY